MGDIVRFFFSSETTMVDPVIAVVHCVTMQHAARNMRNKQHAAAKKVHKTRVVVVKYIIHQHLSS